MDQLAVDRECGGFGLDGGVHCHPFEIARPSLASLARHPQVCRSCAKCFRSSRSPFELAAARLSIPFLEPDRARHAIDSQLARGQWMTSQVIATCWEGGLAAGYDDNI